MIHHPKNERGWIWVDAGLGKKTCCWEFLGRTLLVLEVEAQVPGSGSVKNCCQHVSGVGSFPCIPVAFFPFLQLNPITVLIFESWNTCSIKCYFIFTLLRYFLQYEFIKAQAQNTKPKPPMRHQWGTNETKPRIFKSYRGRYSGWTKDFKLYLLEYLRQWQSCYEAFQPTTYQHISNNHNLDVSNWNRISPSLNPHLSRVNRSLFAQIPSRSGNEKNEEKREKEKRK